MSVKTKESTGFGDRLTQIKNHFNFKSERQFALAMDTSPQNVNNWRRLEETSLVALGKVVATFPEVNPDWLKNGVGEMILARPASTYHDRQKRIMSDDQIVQYEVKDESGTVIIVRTEGEVKSLTGKPSSQVFPKKVMTSAMLPHLPPGSTAWIVKSGIITTSGIYLVRINGEEDFVAVQVMSAGVLSLYQPNGSLFPSSEKLHPLDETTYIREGSSEEYELHVIGRVHSGILTL